MSLTNRFFLYGPFALFVALAALVSARWWIEADAFAKRLDGANGRRIAPGITLHFAGKRVGGFPFRLDATFTDLKIRVDTPHGPSEWQSEDFALHRLTYGARRTLFEAAGHQRLSWTSEDGTHHELPFETGSMRASVIEDDRGPARFDLDINGIGTPAFTALHAQLHVRRDPQLDAVDIALSAEEVHLLTAIRKALGDRIKMVRLGATAVPGKAFETLRTGRAPWPESLRDFSQARGSLHADEFDIALDGLSAEGHGTFALDSALRPNGLFNLRIHESGALPGPDALARSGVSKIIGLLREHGRDTAKSDGSISVVFACSSGLSYFDQQLVGALGTLL